MLGAGVLGGVVGQDNTQPTAEELACWQEYNGGAYFDPNTNVCAVCVPGRYDHDAIINMPHMNMDTSTRHGHEHVTLRHGRRTSTCMHEQI